MDNLTQHMRTHEKKNEIDEVVVVVVVVIEGVIMGLEVLEEVAMAPFFSVSSMFGSLPGYGNVNSPTDDIPRFAKKKYINKLL